MIRKRCFFTCVDHKTFLQAFIAGLLMSVALLFSSCQQELYRGNSAGQKKESPVGKAAIRYAKGFSILYYKNFSLVNVYHNEGQSMDTAEYLLIKRGAAIPDGFPAAQVIETPVRSVIGMSSMHVGLIDFAGAAQLLIGLGNLKYASSAVVRANIKSGKVKEVGQESNLNNELVLTMHPDLVMAVGNVHAKANRFSVLTQAGIPVIQNSEFLESTPLARAEWVKLMGVLTGREEFVNQKFNAVEAEYKRLVKLAANTIDKPHVITGMPVKGTWYVPQGNSYLTHFLQDAGGYTKWTGEKGIGSLPLSFEIVAPEALKADYWLNIGYVNTKDEMTGRDVRFADFKPFKNGNVYNFNKKVNEIGANDYWESGAVNPQWVLADLIKIIHPELLPGHELIYYKQLK
ncbi:ABC transporter substrate-binding protein [Pedobacter sp. AW31-3R]|uniref:ABC transporter substrate-binding protein n=1 Tax=Pedobacter sp. AW31-3R TaxID=3445781 RepID=UPI003FA0D137